MSAAGAVRPLDSQEFAALMASLGPFETGPCLAVGVSGGADSVALVLLARDWAASLGGTVQALTVDHQLRPESAEEAKRVGHWLAECGIPHTILVPDGTGLIAGGRGGLQAAARALRRRLMLDTCRERGIVNLLLAHHADDQAETLLGRLVRGSGVTGLSAMPAVIETAEARILRPLLSVPGRRLVATVEARGHPWIEDPSNEDRRFQRVRLRQAGPVLAGEGLTRERLLATTRDLGRARMALETAVRRRLAQAVRLDPRGFARVEPVGLAAGPDEVALRAIARLVTCIGGRELPPRFERVERLRAALASDGARGRTLGGCRFTMVGNEVIVGREPAALAPPAILHPGGALDWDGRYRIRAAADAPEPVRVQALGGEGWSRLVDENPQYQHGPVPRSVAVTFPGLVPAGSGGTEGWARALVPGRPPSDGGDMISWSCMFRPAVPLFGAGFAVARAGPRIM